MTRNGTVDLCLEEIERLKQARDRAIAQRAGYESHLWFAESLLKQVATVLPELITVDPRTIVVRDTLLEEIREFLIEPRHHPELPDGDVAYGEAGASSSGSEVPHVDI